MTKRAEWLTAAAFLAGWACQGGQDVAQNGALDGYRFSTLEEIKSEFASVPCKNDDRQNAVKSLFERVGADPAEITIDKYKNVENVIVRRPGASTESANQKIVIGAHYDKTDHGCGAVDNWSGVVADVGLRHRAPHPRRRLGDGVGAQVDRSGREGHPRRTRCRRRMRIRSYVSATSPPSKNM